MNNVGEDAVVEQGPEARLDTTPALRVLTPHTTPEEIAALLAVLAASVTTEPPRRPTSSWAAPARRMRPSHHAGPGAWRASGLPR